PWPSPRHRPSPACVLPEEIDLAGRRLEGGGSHQAALRASSRTISPNHCPAPGPPLQVPSDSPGSLTHSRASRWVPSSTRRGRSPRARPRGLHHSPFEPLPLREVSITYRAPPSSAETCSP